MQAFRQGTFDDEMSSNSARLEHGESSIVKPMDEFCRLNSAASRQNPKLIPTSIRRAGPADVGLSEVLRPHVPDVALRFVRFSRLNACA